MGWTAVRTQLDAEESSREERIARWRHAMIGRLVEDLPEACTRFAVAALPVAAGQYEISEVPQRSAELARELLFELFAPAFHECRVCHCTDVTPCSNHCRWVDAEHDLCTNCAAESVSVR
jgi:hypothetical protein